MRIVPSSLPDAYDAPPGANRTACTGPWWPLQVSTSVPLATSKRWTHMSSPPTAMRPMEGGAREADSTVNGKEKVEDGPAARDRASQTQAAFPPAVTKVWPSWETSSEVVQASVGREATQAPARRSQMLRERKRRERERRS